VAAGVVGLLGGFEEQFVGGALGGSEGPGGRAREGDAFAVVGGRVEGAGTGGATFVSWAEEFEGDSVGGDDGVGAFRADGEAGGQFAGADAGVAGLGGEAVSAEACVAGPQVIPEGLGRDFDGGAVGGFGIAAEGGLDAVGDGEQAGVAFPRPALAGDGEAAVGAPERESAIGERAGGAEHAEGGFDDEFGLLVRGVAVGFESELGDLDLAGEEGGFGFLAGHEGDQAVVFVDGGLESHERRDLEGHLGAGGDEGEGESGGGHQGGLREEAGADSRRSFREGDRSGRKRAVRGGGRRGKA
jgi:hypothetical protein